MHAMLAYFFFFLASKLDASQEDECGEYATSMAEEVSVNPIYGDISDQGLISLEILGVPGKRPMSNTPQSVCNPQL